MHTKVQRQYTFIVFLLFSILKVKVDLTRPKYSEKFSLKWCLPKNGKMQIPSGKLVHQPLPQVTIIDLVAANKFSLSELTLICKCTLFSLVIISKILSRAHGK